MLSGSIPWSGLTAEEIRQEVVDNRNSLPVEADKIEPPFDKILQMGLSAYPGCRNLEVENLRDFMTQAVVDRVCFSIPAVLF